MSEFTECIDFSSDSEISDLRDSIARDFEDLGFKVIATLGTSNLLNKNGVFSDNIFKVGEGRPNIVDAIKNNEINIINNVGSDTVHSASELNLRDIYYIIFSFCYSHVWNPLWFQIKIVVVS